MQNYVFFPQPLRYQTPPNIHFVHHIKLHNVCIYSTFICTWRFYLFIVHLISNKNIFFSAFWYLLFQFFVLHDSVYLMYTGGWVWVWICEFVCPFCTIFVSVHLLVWSSLFFSMFSAFFLYYHHRHSVWYSVFRITLRLFCVIFSFFLLLFFRFRSFASFRFDLCHCCCCCCLLVPECCCWFCHRHRIIFIAVNSHYNP